MSGGRCAGRGAPPARSCVPPAAVGAVNAAWCLRVSALLTAWCSCSAGAGCSYRLHAERQVISNQVHGSTPCPHSLPLSFTQIYNEVISDLLKPERTNLVIREDKRRGVFVDGLSEWVVRTPTEVYGLMQRGAEQVGCDRVCWGGVRVGCWSGWCTRLLRRGASCSAARGRWVVTGLGCGIQCMRCLHEVV